MKIISLLKSETTAVKIVGRGGKHYTAASIWAKTINEAELCTWKKKEVFWDTVKIQRR